MILNVSIKQGKEYKRIFKICAADKMEAYTWGEKQAEEFGLSSAKIEVFDYVEEKKAG